MPKKPTKSKKAAKPAAPKHLTVGQTLKTRRLTRGLSLKDVELATRIRGKYLVALEGDDYQTLPHDVYTRGFVQSYANFLELDGSATSKAYLEERGRTTLQLRRTSTITPQRIVLTPRLLTGLMGVIAAIIVGTYLYSQVNTLTAPPRLSVTNPAKDQVLYGSLITMTGHVDGGADVYVNDSPILVDGSGNFSDPIALQDGVNSIGVSATNRLGKTSRITRSILAHVPKTDPASLLPSTPFDGVAISVAVQGSATLVAVNIDGKQAFKGTMLPGTTQTFKGRDKVIISTSNAGSTSLIVTNSLVASKNLGVLGKNGQVRDDFRFDKSTQFQ